MSTIIYYLERLTSFFFPKIFLILKHGNFSFWFVILSNWISFQNFSYFTIETELSVLFAQHYIDLLESFGEGQISEIWRSGDKLMCCHSFLSLLIRSIAIQNFINEEDTWIELCFFIFYHKGFNWLFLLLHPPQKKKKTKKKKEKEIVSTLKDFKPIKDGTQQEGRFVP